MRIFLVATFLALSVAGSAAHAEVLTPPETGYSALRVVNTGNNEISGKVYAQDRNERWEMTLQGVRQISILQHDRGRAYLYMPSMNMAMKMDTADAKKYGVGEIFSGIEAREAGSDIVNGEETIRYVIPADPQKGTPETTVWMTEDGIPVKAEGEGPQGPFSMVLKDLERGTQDPSLFELPAGVTPMAIPAGLPGMMRGGGMPSIPGMGQ